MMPSMHAPIKKPGVNQSVKPIEPSVEQYERGNGREHRPADAVQVYREDLKRFPENGWALFGLAQALRAQGKTADAAKVDARFKKAWQDADVKLVASRF